MSLTFSAHSKVIIRSPTLHVKFQWSNSSSKAVSSSSLNTTWNSLPSSQIKSLRLSSLKSQPLISAVPSIKSWFKELKRLLAVDYWIDSLKKLRLVEKHNATLNQNKSINRPPKRKKLKLVKKQPIQELEQPQPVIEAPEASSIERMPLLEPDRLELQT